MIKIGMMIGDRYEILEKIGTGGMSDVYKAKDHKLNRFVAVKVLKQEFSENANFVSKFRIEAQAAAGLAHPNIVNVYDVGEEEGIYYIVMELVEGITLKKYIEKKSRLSVKEAISIAIQVSMGIEAAHNNHIIHRDIKPQNIIISKEGKVKVTDFGIAKAATSNTITSNVMGSVHYTSPEQARGGYSDEKSDIYSLGITMFEMLTGRVPFNGETTVAIAIMHIQEEMPSPREYVPEIPVSVEQIVEKCCQKSPDRRYQSMSELVMDLKRSLMTPDERFVKTIDPDEEASTRVMDEEDVVRVKRKSQPRDSVEEAMRLRKEKDVKREADREERRVVKKKKIKKKKVKRAVPVKQPAKRRYEEPEDAYKADEDELYENELYEDELYEDEEYYEDYENEEDYDIEDDYEAENLRKEKITTILAVIAAVLIGLGVLFLVSKAMGIFEPEEEKGEQVTEQEGEGEEIEMFGVIGKHVDDVKVLLLEKNLTPEIEYEESSEFAEGIVMNASVKEGEMVKEGTNVILTVSAGSQGIEVPKVIGLSEAEAVSNLEQKGFVVSKTEGFDQYIQKGNIMSQSPEAGSMAPSGATVTICISKGAEIAKISVPSVMGKDEEEATLILLENGLALGKVEETHHADPTLEGLVCYQSYSEGSFVDAGTSVDIKISIGPEAATYRFTDRINPPSPEEDSQYRSGTLVTVTVLGEDGTSLFSTQTASFPMEPLNITGIKSEKGVILFQYQNETDATSITNDDGTVTTIPGSIETKEIRRAITFVAE